MPRIDSKLFYEAALQKYGITPEGLHWNSELYQKIRFDIILDMLPDDLENFTLCDAGCGFGDFYAYMRENSRISKKYIGIDSLETMCAIAKERTKCEILQADICKEPLPHADFYICSGAMNILTEFETHLFIRNCFTACESGFIFNILHGDNASQTYNYISTSQIKEIAKELGVKQILYSDEYIRNDITVGFFK
ncbi:MAG: class I SAM-dependent methyltransferase [Sulfurimonas sp.]|nr:class I SAM-dependent methyltransferase [Sulfurimonas sp.]